MKLYLAAAAIAAAVIFILVQGLDDKVSALQKERTAKIEAAINGE